MIIKTIYNALVLFHASSFIIYMEIFKYLHYVEGKYTINFVMYFLLIIKLNT